MIYFLDAPEIVKYDDIIKLIKKKHRNPPIVYDIYKEANAVRHKYGTCDYNRMVFDKLMTLLNINNSHQQQPIIIKNGLLYLIIKAQVDEDDAVLSHIKNMISSELFRNTNTLFFTKKINCDNISTDQLAGFIAELKEYNKAISKYEIYINDTAKNNHKRLVVMEEDDDKFNMTKLEEILRTIREV